MLVVAQTITELTNDLTSARCGDLAPREEGPVGAINDSFVLVFGDLPNGGDPRSINRGDDGLLGSGPEPFAGEAAGMVRVRVSIDHCPS